LRRTTSWPITFGLLASSIIAAMIGTATTPVTTALQYKAFIGSIGVKPSAVPASVATMMIA
jgi:hypothetical protein